MPHTLAAVLCVFMIHCDKCQRCASLCPFLILSCKKILGGDDDEASMARCRHLLAVPGARVNRAAAVCFICINTLCLCCHQRFTAGKSCWNWNEVPQATVVIFVICKVLSACPQCSGLAWSLQVRSQDDHEEQKEKGQQQKGACCEGHGAEQAGQTTDEGAGRVQTDRSPHFLQLPSPYDIKGNDNPHWQAAEVAEDMRHFFVLMCTVVLLFHSFLHNITWMYLRISQVLTHCAASGSRPRAQKSTQSLHSNQRWGQDQHHAIRVVEKQQEAQGDDITERAQLSQPGLKDAKETQKSWERQMTETVKAVMGILILASKCLWANKSKCSHLKTHLWQRSRWRPPGSSSRSWWDCGRQPVKAGTTNWRPVCTHTIPLLSPTHLPWLYQNMYTQVNVRKGRFTLYLGVYTRVFLTLNLKNMFVYIFIHSSFLYSYFNVSEWFSPSLMAADQYFHCLHLWWTLDPTAFHSGSSLRKTSTVNTHYF